MRNSAMGHRPWRRALLWLLLLGPFFFLTYGFANWVASRRTGIGAIVFEWEHRVPFLSWTILPYWSIDLLYAISLFICTTRRELDIHARRLLCAQIICVACFLLFPLHYTFVRPATEGFFGLMFDALMGFDKPYNQMPSLHIALLIVIWVRYVRHVSGHARWIVHAWAALIFVSVLTTYQHHFIDVPTGLWVGWFCVWLFPEHGRFPSFTLAPLANTRRRTLALCYGGIALIIGTISLRTGGWTLWLLWISGSLALVATIYAFLEESAFQKNGNGSMSAAAHWLLAPYFACAWLNARWWTRGLPAAHLIVPGLLLGRVLTPREREAHNIRAIVDMTAELPCNAKSVRYVNVPQLDLTDPSAAQIERAVAAIDSVFKDGPVLVCCALGFSRSAIAVAAWLVATRRAADHSDAIAQIRRARPAVVINNVHVLALERYAAGRASS
ncbi:MAG TPA: phosphatase PAP2/dual specificity phosphatase family protein [Burkholderiales bacterium]